jgi:glyoxylase-like metal-dependent hydrolase (beta-lactamase superfamily II)
MMLVIGELEISCIEEVVLDEPTTLFAEWKSEILEQHRGLLVPRCFDPAANAFKASIRSYLVKTPRQTILIDTGAGNDKPRPAAMRFDHLETPYLDRLKRAGATPEQIDLVICTHLHVDHIGWNTRLVEGRWVPTFPNAKYVLPRIEVEARDPARGAANRPPATHLPYQDSVQPIIDAGLAVLVEGSERLSDGLMLMPTPGHAPGQMAVQMRSHGQEVMFVADVMHQPIQIYFPAWNSKFCENPELAARTRRLVLDHCAAHGSLMLPTHFNYPLGGTISRDGDGFAFSPAREDH